MTDKKTPETFTPSDRQDWRNWLKQHYDSKQLVWLIYYRNIPGKATITYAEAVDEALCYGWIDSTLRSQGDGMFMQQFTKRKATSVWSKINKEKIKKLIAEGLMAEPGFESIRIAKKNGSWKLYDQVEQLKIPKDLNEAFLRFTGSKKYFQSLSKSIKKQMLHWIIQAKRPETREKRIREIAELAGQNIRPAQFR